jgi:hypothetical protein
MGKQEEILSLFIYAHGGMALEQEGILFFFFLLFI